MQRLVLCLSFVLLEVAALGAQGNAPPAAGNSNRIKPYSANAHYWQYKGQPVLLLGGTKDDSLFEIPDLKEHLDLLESVGGNYIRNTMSARVDKGFEVQAFGRLPDGKYDLMVWNDEYWTRFENLLRWTHERDVIVQIEVWDRFDYTDARGMDHWQASPYRPANNVNYSAAETGLADRYPDHPSRDKHPFFHTIPTMKEHKSGYDAIRTHQERFVTKVLSYSLPYGNVLYCMNNETSTSPEWGRYWMALIQTRAAEEGVEVYTTDMFDDGWKPETSEKLRQAFDDPGAYPFIDISQVNSRNFNEDHWRRLQWVLDEVDRHPRPVNNTKIYGSGNSSWGSGAPEDGVERFWRNVLGGCASARFHRDGSGNGLQPIAQASLRAARKMESLVKMWDVEPHNELLDDRADDEAYLAARPGKAYALYFTDGGSVKLDLTGASGPLKMAWINVGTGQWGKRDTLPPAAATIAAPGGGGWVAVLLPLD